ncbi:MAG: DUF1080 domain-containing protein [Fuerstiella sp.]|nr:DUF1080 domain-containing protein [Fuerstiella sp.]
MLCRIAVFSLIVTLFQSGCQHDSTEVPRAVGDKSPVGERSDSQTAEAAEAEPFHFLTPNLTPEQIRDGWISLFDGATLFGWDVPALTNWHVEDGCIVADSGEESLLTTPFKFDNFELRCEFYLEPDGNSGVFLRTAADPRDPATDTYELNICDSHEAFPTGSLVARHKAVDVPAVEGAWHLFRVICDGPHIQVWLDQKSIVDFTDESGSQRSTGVLGLQMREGRIAFRDVFIRPIGITELFDGESLKGWSVVDGSQSEFGVVNGAIHVSNGPGFLQTNSVHRDFCLHVEARTNGKELNSGIFFRAMPGTKDSPSHGYEFQIHHGFKNDDRTKPADSGTGAVFRRVAARYVVADDHEWFYGTLIAQGDRIATWVNGYQVVNWKDTREADENPRRGRRLEPGHISLQGHDPTTDLEFRSVSIHDFTGG